jgi:hypothetical protein
VTEKRGTGSGQEPAPKEQSVGIGSAKLNYELPAPLSTPIGQLIGSHVIMADDCAGFRADGACLSREAIIGDEREMWCANCGAYRKKLSVRAVAFLTEIISKFGWPDNPITLRRAIGFIRSPDLFLPGNSNPQHMKRRYRNMDMRQYGQTTLQPEDLQKTGGQHRGVIEEVRPPEPGAKFPKPILVLSDAKLVQLNKSSVGKLMAEFGYDSASWVGRSVLLTVQRDLINNKEAVWINAEPLIGDASIIDTRQSKPKLKSFP